MRNKTQRILSLLLAVLIIHAAALPARAEEASQSIQSAEASTMQLMRTEGTVSVTSSNGRSLSARDNMRLYNGYHVATQAASYAWINLDSEKLTKLDEVSEAELRKSGRALELMLNSGSLYFNVTSPLAADETLNIRTSTMAVGIRGTSGWIRVSDRWSSEIYVLEGKVECSVTDPVTGQIKSAVIGSGEKATAVVYPQDKEGDKCDILLDGYQAEEIDGFALVELAADPVLCEEILQASGMDILGSLGAAEEPSPEAALEAAQQRLERDQQAMRSILDRIASQVAQQESNVSTSPVWRQEGAASGAPVPLDPSSAPDAPGTPGPSNSSAGGSSSDRDTSSGNRRPSGGGSSGSGSSSGGGGSSGGGSSSVSSSEGSSSSEPEREFRMPMTASEVQQYLTSHGAGSYTLLPSLEDDSAENLLTVDTALNIPAGTTLNLSSGIGVLIDDGSNLAVNGVLTGTEGLFNLGTLTVDGSFTSTGGLNNLGTLIVNSPNTLTVSLLMNEGVLENTANGHIVTESLALSGEGELTNRGKIDANNNIDVKDPRCSFVMEGGTVNGDIFILNGGFEMKGGTVNGTVTAYSGDITMSGGEVTSSTADPTVSCSHGNLILNSGTITNNGTGSAVQSPAGYELTIGDTLIRAKIRDVFLIGGSNMTPAFSGPRYDNSSGYYYLVWGDYFGTAGNLLWDLTKETGVLTVSGKGAIPDSPLAATYKGYYKTIVLMDGITGIGDTAFTSCGNLEEVIIPASVTSIGRDAFNSCSSLTSITIPDGVISIGDNAFHSCSSLRSLTIPNSVTTIGSSVFNSCGNLTSVTIPASVTEIGEGSFGVCTALTNVTILANITTIESDMFSGCSNLTSVTIPASVTSIGNYAFSGCSNLTSVAIPAGVTSVGNYTFYGCDNLENVYYGGSESQWNQITFGYDNDQLTGAAIHYNEYPLP